MPRPRMPFRRRSPAANEAESATAVAPQADPVPGQRAPEAGAVKPEPSAVKPEPGAAKPEAGAGKPKAGAGAVAPSSAPVAARAGPPAARPDPHERIDALRAWLGQIDRKIALRTYLFGAIALLALAAAVVALVLVLQLKRDAATDSDVQSLRNDLSGVQRSASQAAQRGVASLNRRLGDLESEVGRLSTQQTTSKRELQVVQDDVKELRSEVANAGGQAGTAPGGAAGGASQGAGGAFGTGTGGAGASGGTGP